VVVIIDLFIAFRDLGLLGHSGRCHLYAKKFHNIFNTLAQEESNPRNRSPQKVLIGENIHFARSHFARDKHCYGERRKRTQAHAWTMSQGK
jgi:hypothetical protein